MGCRHIFGFAVQRTEPWYPQERPCSRARRPADARIDMPGPLELTLELTPGRASTSSTCGGHSSHRFGDALDAYPRALCCSFHTTAGYLDPGVAARLNQSRAGVMPYIDVFRTMFPEGAGYEHDKMDRRTELTEEQKPVEPQNADSHLAFMAGALRTCVAYPNRPGEPICFIDLDGVHAGHPRRRLTTVLGYIARGTGRAHAARRSGLGPRRRLGESQESAASASTSSAPSWWRSTA